MPRKVWAKSIFANERDIEVYEGSIFTHDAYEQWHGWSGKRRYVPGLQEQWRELRNELYWMAPYIEQMITEGVTHTWHGLGKTEKVISEYAEEDFYADLEGMRDALNDWLNEAAKRRPLQRRIELAQAMVDHPQTEPEVRDAARNRIEALKQRLEESER